MYSIEIEQHIIPSKVSLSFHAQCCISIDDLLSGLMSMGTWAVYVHHILYIVNKLHKTSSDEKNSTMQKNKIVIFKIFQAQML